MRRWILVGALFNLTQLGPLSATSVGQDCALSVSGRVVDCDGSPVAGAEVRVNYGPGASQLYYVVTGADGRFHLDRQAIVYPGERKLFVTGPAPRHSAQLVGPPFNEYEHLTGVRFRGVPVSVPECADIDMRDVAIQVEYEALVVSCLDADGRLALTAMDAWQSVWIRVRDSNGERVDERTLSIKEIEEAVDLKASAITLALPEGVWSIEVALDAPSMRWGRVPDPVRIEKGTPPPRVEVVVPRRSR